MKNIKLAVVLCGAVFTGQVLGAQVLASELVLNGAVPEAALTRSVNVVEKGVTKQYLGTQFGQTLYTFDLDSGSASACSGACAEKWPPLLVSDVDAKALIAPFASIVRSNGLIQVTHDGKPLYTYYLDHAEGNDLGNGIGSVWHDIDFVK